MEDILLHVIAKSGLGGLDGADAAEEIGVDLRGGVGLDLVILAAIGNIVGITGQEDQIAALHDEGGDDCLEEGMDSIRVLERRVPQGHKQLVLRSRHHLLGGKREIQQVFAQRSR